METKGLSSSQELAKAKHLLHIGLKLRLLVHIIDIQSFSQTENKILCF